MVGSNSKKTSKLVTVQTVVQREKSRPFAQGLANYQKKLREKKERDKRGVSKDYIKQSGLTKREKLRRVAEYASSKTSRGITGTLNNLQRGATTRRLYRQPVSPYGSNIRNYEASRRTGRRGRPVGTVDPRYAKYGGVYGYRKAMAMERFKQRQQILQDRAITPSQQRVLQEVRMREQMQRQNPEGRIIPSTEGNVFTSNIQEEIERATHIFD